MRPRIGTIRSMAAAHPASSKSDNPSAPLEGGTAGRNVTSSAANAGASGGNGGPAGDSASGGGGPSIGIAFVGSTAVQSNVVFSLGPGGDGGEAGSEARGSLVVRREAGSKGAVVDTANF